MVKEEDMRQDALEKIKFLMKLHYITIEDIREEWHIIGGFEKWL